MATSDAGSVRLDLEYPDRLSRLHLLLKVFLGWLYVGVPHGIVLSILVYVALVLHVIAFIAILITGKYPPAIFNFMVGLQRWSMRVDAYTNLMNDQYPPFALGNPAYPMTLEIPYPQNMSRGSATVQFFLGWLYAGIPHLIVLSVLGIIAVLAIFIAFFAILITGKYPRGLFNFVEGYMRWSLRLIAYLLLLDNRYPPFRLSA